MSLTAEEELAQRKADVKAREREIVGTAPSTQAVAKAHEVEKYMADHLGELPTEQLEQMSEGEREAMEGVMAAEIEAEKGQIATEEARIAKMKPGRAKKLAEAELARHKADVEARELEIEDMKDYDAKHRESPKKSRAAGGGTEATETTD